MKKKEIRAIKTEFRVEKTEKDTKIIGYAARFNELSELLYGFFKEKISPGAFDEVLKNCDVRALFNHDENYVLGRSSSGTLKLFTDEVGLRYEINPPNTQWAKDLIESMERGDIRESSFGFIPEDEEWKDDEEPYIRTIKKIKRLFDVSPVTFPAYPTTSSGVRSTKDVAEDFKNKKAKLENRKNSKMKENENRLKIAEKIIF